MLARALISALGVVAMLMPAPSAFAISAPIRIAKTGGDGVFMRPGPNTSGKPVGWMPEGASPDYNCFVWGQRINDVPIWFSVNYGGVTGFYASAYDDSTYGSNEELTAKYGVPQCGEAGGDSLPPDRRPSGAVYFSPFNAGSFELNDQSIATVYLNEYENGCTSSWPAYGAAMRAVGRRAVATLAGWSKGRIGVMSYLKRATPRQLARLEYVLLIDPGTYGELECDRDLAAGARITRWLLANRAARLVVISGSQISQQESSKGIQETYFNAIRSQTRNTGVDLRARVLTCNYSIDHKRAFRTGQYWINHRIGSRTTSCPWLSEGKETFKPTSGWHP
jgi:hypothetical protein